MLDTRLSIRAYSTGTTLVHSAIRELARAEDIEFSTIYPGGLYKDASFFIPRDPDLGWLLNGAQRFAILNGLQTVYEGAASALGYTSTGRSGRRISSPGLWGQLLAKAGWNKPWSDNRLDDAHWVLQTGATGNDKCSPPDRTNRIRWVPKAVLWNNGEYVEVKWTAPTGETFKKITYDYNLQEGAQSWEIAIRNVGTAADVVSVTTSGPATSQTHTFATPTQSVALRFYARANQTPAADGTIYGEFSNITLYTETSAISLTEIAKDIRAHVSGLSSYEGFIGSNTYDLTPFVTDGYEPLASVINKAAAFGDSSFNPWAAYLLGSGASDNPNGKPVLAVEQWPSLSTYDYAVRLGEPGVVLPEIIKDFDNIWNWIPVKYRDELDNRDVILTPDDDANLKDSTSITSWGQREAPILDAGVSNATVAKAMARRYLAEHKDPRFRASGNIQVTGTIRQKNGTRIQACRVRAGKRVKIENFFKDEIGVSGAGLTFAIVQTGYRDTGRQLQMTCGSPDYWAVRLAQSAF